MNASVRPARIGLTSQVVAIIENIAPHPDELDHRPHVRHDRLARELEVALGVAGAERRSLLEGHLRGDVARQRIVRRRLVGDEVEVLAAGDELGEHVRRVPEHADGQRPALRGGRPHAREPVVERVATSSR